MLSKFEEVIEGKYVLELLLRFLVVMAAFLAWVAWVPIGLSSIDGGVVIIVIKKGFFVDINGISHVINSDGTGYWDQDQL
jgi:hypothetical protein